MTPIAHARCPPLALFCRANRANRAEQCRLSGVDRPTYAQCEFSAFWTHCGHKQGRNTAAQQVSCRTELCYPFSGKTRGACSACPDPGNSGLAERLARADEVIE